MTSHCHGGSHTTSSGDHHAASGSSKGKSRLPLYIVGFLVGAALVFWIAQNSSSQNKGNAAASSSVAEQSDQGGVLSIEEEAFSFGSVSMAAGSVTKRIRVSNTGSGPLTLKKLYTSCMCTTVSLLSGENRIGPFGMPGHGFIPSFQEVLQPGQSAEVEVTFDPAAHGPAGVGRINRVVSLEHSGSSKPAEIKFDALVNP